MKRETPLRAIQRWLYLTARQFYLKEHRVCEACYQHLADQIHHKAGREGWLLCWMKYWLATCGMCHRWITANGCAATAAGFKVEIPPTTREQRAEIESEIRAYIKQRKENQWIASKSLNR